MLIIGLTGGIGSGKSTVADMFKELGIDIIDTDLIARDIVKPGTKALKEITKHFKDTIISNNGTIDRTALRKEIFDDPTEKEWLENLLHPLIREEAKKQISQAKSPYCMVIIPLLLETKKIDEVNRVLVIDTTEKLQIERTVARDHCSRDMVLKMIATQVPRQKRLAGADNIILNNGNLAYLKLQVLRLHDRLLKISNEASR